jgi:hypothetical protein
MGRGAAHETMLCASRAAIAVRMSGRTSIGTRLRLAEWVIVDLLLVQGSLAMKRRARRGRKWDA